MSGYAVLRLQNATPNCLGEMGAAWRMLRFCVETRSSLAKRAEELLSDEWLFWAWCCDGRVWVAWLAP
eukprot:6210181-Pleurochrysis_carterae.AAC.3